MAQDDRTAEHEHRLTTYIIEEVARVAPEGQELARPVALRQEEEVLQERKRKADRDEGHPVVVRPAEGLDPAGLHEVADGQAASEDEGRHA